MRPTIAWVREKVKEWNVRCFGGALPPLPVQLTRARSYCGQLAYMRRKGSGREYFTDFRLRISILFDHEEESVIDTIIHELIHYEILYTGQKDTAPHGELFQRRMNEINRRFGRHITISEKLSAEQLDSDQRQLHHLLCIARFTDGGFGVTRVARTCIFDIWDRMHDISKIKEFIWLWSRDPYFNRFRRSRTVVSYRLDTAQLRSHLADAYILRREGNIIRPGQRFDADSWFDKR